MVIRELPLGEDVDLARRATDIQHTAGRVRRDLTSSLILGLPYRFLIWAALLLVIPRLNKSQIHYYQQLFKSRHVFYTVIIKLVSKFNFLCLKVYFLYLYFYFYIYYLKEHTLKVSRKGLSWSQDISELVDDPYQAT